MKEWIVSGLRPILSKGFLTIVSALVAANLLYGFAIALNPLLIYLSLLFLILYGVFLALRDDSIPKKRTSRKVALSLAVILLCSLLLRGIGATWGFPIFGHPDEYVVTDPAVRMIEHNSLDPVNHNHPNHISIYASEILYPVIAKVLSGERVSPSFEKDSRPYYLASRLVTAGWGILMVVAAWLIGSMAAPAVGIVAAVLFAIFPPFVEHSHYITPDVPVTALLMFVLLYSMRYLKDGRLRDIFLALVLSSVATAEKYPAFLALPLLLAIVAFRGNGEHVEVFAPRGSAPLRKRKAVILILFVAVILVGTGAYVFRHPHLSAAFQKYISSALHKAIPPNFTARIRMLSKLLMAGGVLLGALGVFLRYLRGQKYGISIFVLFGMPLVLFLVTPFLFINFSGVFSSLSGEARDIHLGADNLGYVGNFLFYAKGYLDAAGIVSLVFMVIAAATVFRQRPLLPLFFSFFYLVCLSALGLHWLRWGLPMFVGPLVLVSIGLHRSFLYLAMKMGRAGAATVLAVLCALPFASMLLSSVTTTYKFVLPDTRAVALAWCGQHGVTSENTLYDGYSPFNASSATTINYPGSSDAKYVIVTSEMYDRYLAEKERYKSQADMYMSIFKLPLLASFKPVEAGVSSSFELGNIPLQLDFLRRLSSREDPAYSGPTILIYQNAS